MSDSVGCWEMQVVALEQCGSIGDHLGGLEGYSGGVHAWQVLWLR